jgi:DNA-binding transcriptional LysR family regulator
MLPSASDLRYFLEVSNTGKLSRAAVRLGISQPALTQAMKKLEATVGLPLLIRTRTGVRLTRAGERIAAHAAQLLEAWDEIRRAALEDEQEIKGRYRLGCHVAVAQYTLPRLFRDLATHAPGVEIQLFHDLSRRLIDALIDFQIDLGFVVNPVPHPDLVLRKLGTDVVTVFEAARGRYGTDLFGDPELGQTRHVLKKLNGAALGAGRFVACPSLEVIRTLVASGAGFGILPTRVAQSSPGAQLRAIKDQAAVFHDEIYLAYRPEVMASRAGKTVVRLAAGAIET